MPFTDENLMFKALSDEEKALLDAQNNVQEEPNGESYLSANMGNLSSSNFNDLNYIPAASAAVQQENEQIALDAMNSPFDIFGKYYPNNVEIEKPQDNFALINNAMAQGMKPIGESQATGTTPNKSLASKTSPSSAGSQQDQLGSIIKSSQPQTDEELRQALSQQKQDLLSAILLQSGSDIGRSIIGQEKDKDFAKPFMDMANLPVEQLKIQRQGDRDKLKDISQQKAFEYEQQKNDPNSAITKAAQATRIKFLREMKMNDLADKIEKNNLTAKQLEDTFGELNLNNLYTQYESGEQRKLQLQLMKADKDSNNKAKFDNKQQAVAKSLSDRVNAIDKEVAFSALATTASDLKSKLNSGKYNGVDDIMSIYALIKAIDPGSVVKEGEVSLIFKADSPFAKAGNLPSKLLKGSLASPDMRKKIMNALDRLQTVRQNQYDAKIAPYVKQAEKQGIKREDIDISIPFRVDTKQVESSNVKSEDDEAINWAKQNPKDPRAKQILSLHGMN